MGNNGDMQSGPLNLDDFVEGNFNEQLKTLASQLKATFSDASIDSTQKIKILNSALKDLTKGTQEQFLVSKLLSDVRKTEKDSITTINSAYAASSIQLQKLAQTYKDLAISQGLNSDATKKALLEHNQLKDTITKVDQAMGNYSKNVGNYTNQTLNLGSALRRTGEGVRGLTGLLGVLGEAVGFDKEVTEGLMNIHSKSREAMRSLTEAQRALGKEEGIETEIKEENIAMTDEQLVSNEALIASNEEVGLSWIAQAGLIGIAVVALAGIGYAIYEYIEQSKAMKELNELLNKENEDTVKWLKKEKDAIYELLVAQGKLSDSDVKKLKNTDAAAESLGHLIAVRDREMQKLKESMGTPTDPGIFNGGGLSALSVYQAALTKYTAYIAAKKKIDDEYNSQYKAIDITLNAQQKAVDINANKKAQKDFELEKEIELARVDLIKESAEKKEIAKLEIERKYALLEEQNSSDEQKVINEKLAQINVLYALKERLAQNKEREEELKKYQEFLDKVIALYKKHLEEKKKAFDETTKKRDKASEENLKFNVETGAMDAADTTKFDELHKAKPDTIAKDKKIELAYSVEKEIEAINENEVLNEATKQARIDEINRRAAQSALAIDKEAQKEKDKIREEEFLKNIKQQEEIFKYLQQAQQAEIELKRNSLDEQLQLIQSNIQVQSALAAAGKKNSLDAELKAQAKALDEKAALDRKEKQQKETAALVDLFFQMETAFVKGGTAPSAAAAKAFEQVVLSKTIAAGLSAFHEGTADTGMGGGIDGKGGFVAVLHPHEAVISHKRKEEMPGMAEAWHFKGESGVLDYMNKNYQFAMDKPIDSQINEKLINTMVQGFESLKEAIIHKKESTVIIGSEGDKIIEERMDGIIRTIVKAKYPIIKGK